MDAGRELDALVACRVMGEPEYWSVHFGGSHYGDFKSLAAAEVCAKKIQGDYKARKETYFDCPHYSTNIAAAWTVLEKLLAMNVDDVRFTTIALAPATNGRWAAFAGCCEVDDEHEWFEHRPLLIADTAPLAICLAALRAVGHSL